MCFVSMFSVPCDNDVFCFVFFPLKEKGKKKNKGSGEPEKNKKTDKK